MKKNCNLELRLFPPSASASINSDDDHHHHHHKNDITNGSPKEEKEQLTLFYNGTVSACEVTELQARAIIFFASQQMAEKSKSPSLNGSDPLMVQSQMQSPSLNGSDPLMVQSQMQSPTSTDLSMKRSLQRFLQKRKHRIQSTSPYHH
ncbi:hypothetical protein LguiB_033880 [Lonicera macranthoides]